MSTVSINQLDTLPVNNLAILKDDIGSTDIFSLCLKLDNIENTTFDFKISYTQIDDIPVCILMIKNNDKIYKCLLRLDLFQEFNELKKLMSLNTFNLFIIHDNKKSIIKIQNPNCNKFVDAIKNVNKHFAKSNNIFKENIKNKILNIYSDSELWNLNNI